MLGNGRLEAFCFDGKVRLCHMCVACRGGGRSGSCPYPSVSPPIDPTIAAARCARRCGWAPATSSWCPCATTRCGGGAPGRPGARAYRRVALQDDKGDVILKYTADEARQLKSSGQLPENGAAHGCPPALPPARPLSPVPLPLQSSSTRESAAARMGRTAASTSTTTTAAPTTTSTSTPSEPPATGCWGGDTVGRVPLGSILAPLFGLGSGGASRVPGAGGRYARRPPGARKPALRARGGLGLKRPLGT